MKYSDLYMQLKGIDKAMTRDFVIPLDEIVSESLQPIIEDLVQIYENNSADGESTGAHV